MENKTNYNDKKLNLLNEEYILLSPTKEDIYYIKELCYYFWEEEGIYTEDFYEEVFAQDLSLIYKDKEEEILIALCLNLYSKKRNEVSIAVLCVREEYQRKGLGESILNSSIDKCMKRGYNNFCLHVATTNEKAIRLYKKVGFTISETIKNYYHDDLPPNNNAYLMKLIKNKKEEPNKILINNNNINNNIIQKDFSMVECKNDNDFQKHYDSNNDNLCYYIYVIIFIIIIIVIVVIIICLGI